MPHVAIWTIGFEMRPDASPFKIRFDMNRDKLRWHNFEGKSKMQTDKSHFCSMKYLFILIVLMSCSGGKFNAPKAQALHGSASSSVITGAERTTVYLPLLQSKRVAVAANATSIVGQKHLIDTLLASGIHIIRAFAPEHGFRGDHGAGEHVANDKDSKTGISIFSLYGKNKKPSPSSLQDIDVVVFDMQDVGARFYTYISTMHYLMEACAEQNKKLIVLDRPNPNGHIIDGPVLDTNFRSFVGMHPIPVLHGLTVGELAMMINGERWLAGGLTCDLEIIACENYTHATPYSLPVAPSPNLSTDTSIALYPSLCFFEGTQVSVGRGTAYPFQCYGYPGYEGGNFTFTPKDIKGKVTDPPYEGERCDGQKIELNKPLGILELKWLLDAYAKYPKPNAFFSSPSFFDKLAGTDKLRKDILAGKNASEIRLSWQNDLDSYRIKRRQYLLYPDLP